MEFRNPKVLAVKPNISACLIFAVLALLVVGRVMPAFGNTTSSTSVPACTVADLSHGTQTASTSISRENATDAAAQTLAQYTTEYTAQFNSIVYHTTWTSNCVVSIESVVVAYDLTATNGTSYVLEITESPSLTSIISAHTYQAERHYVNGGTADNPSTWSGYEYYDSNGISTVFSYWYAPEIIGAAYSGECTSYANDTCAFSFWVGAEDHQGAEDGKLPQTGTDSACAGSCTTSGDGDWTEFHLALQSPAPP